MQQFPSGAERSSSPVLNPAGPSRSFDHSGQSTGPPSVDEASSALAQLLDIDDNSASPSQARSSNASASGAGGSRRVYQHALSVRVPPNNQNNSGAIPRRKRQQNNTEES